MPGFKVRCAGQGFGFRALGLGFRAGCRACWRAERRNKQEQKHRPHEARAECVA